MRSHEWRDSLPIAERFTFLFYFLPPPHSLRSGRAVSASVSRYVSPDPRMHPQPPPACSPCSATGSFFSKRNPGGTPFAQDRLCGLSMALRSFVWLILILNARPL